MNTSDNNLTSNLISNSKKFTEVPFAEITESSISSWTAQSWDWKVAPSLGSLIKVKVSDLIIFGTVYYIKTGSNDQNRTVYPFGKTEEELLRDQPEIFQFLSTTFSCLTLGYIEDNKLFEDNRLFYHLAPKPPTIHSFVQETNYEELKLFFSSSQYLQVLFTLSHHLISLDELLIAIIKNISDKNILTKSILTDFVQTFSLLTAGDYSRLKLFLRRIQPVLINNLAN